MSQGYRCINSWQDLEVFGVQSLTGEACGLGMRILCDVTHTGKGLIEEFFGSTVQVVENSNWNSKGVGSVMLPYSILPELAAYALLRSAKRDPGGDGGVVVTMANGAAWYSSQEWEGKGRRMLELFPDRYVRTYHVTGTAGMRNRHEMSGRVN